MKPFKETVLWKNSLILTCRVEAHTIFPPALSEQTLLPQAKPWCHCTAKNPHKPFPVEVNALLIHVLTQWSASILETGNVNHQSDWVLLPPGGRVCRLERNSPSQ